MSDKMMLCGSIKSLNEIYINNYIAEQKFDGERILLIKKGNSVSMLNRRGALKEDVYIELKEEMATLNFDFIIDGEVCSTNGLFNDLQRRALLRNTAEIQKRRETIPIIFHIFDIIELNGENKTMLPLMERKKLLTDNFGKLTPNLITAELTPYVEGEENINALWSKIVNEKKEGIVLKLKDGVYVFKRSNNWVKLKTWETVDLKMTKYTINNAGIRLENDNGDAVQCSGFQADGVKKQMDELGYAIVEVQFLEKTNDKRLRFPSFKCLK